MDKKGHEVGNNKLESINKNDKAVHVKQAAYSMKFPRPRTLLKNEYPDLEVDQLEVTARKKNIGLIGVRQGIIHPLFRVTY